MRRMKQRMNDASRQFFIMPWELHLHKSQGYYALHVSHSQDISWVEVISRWHPPDVAGVSSHSQDINWVEVISRWHPPDMAGVSLPQNPKNVQLADRALDGTMLLRRLLLPCLTIRSIGLTRYATTLGTTWCS